MYPRTRASKQASQCYKSNSESMSKRGSEWVNECMGSLERLKNIHFMAGHPQLWLVTQRIGSRCMLKSGLISQTLQPKKSHHWGFQVAVSLLKVQSPESLTWSTLAPWTLSTSNSMALQAGWGATEVDGIFHLGVKKYHVNIEHVYTYIYIYTQRFGWMATWKH